MCVYVHVSTYLCLQVLEGARRGHQFLRAGVRGGCEQPEYDSWEPKSGLLKEQQVLNC